MLTMSTDVGVDCNLQFISEDTEVQSLNNLLKITELIKERAKI